ncbi:MAG: hypothetical protein WC479_04620 [Candidatus Izemoplasmatales bacterium]
MLEILELMHIGFFIYLKDRTISNSDKIREMEDMKIQCDNAIKIMLGNGTITSSHLANCLDEQIVEECKDKIIDVQRLDKKVECRKCYHQFWIDNVIPLKLAWCPNCNSTNLQLAKIYGKPVRITRTYIKFEENDDKTRLI